MKIDVNKIKKVMDVKGITTTDLAYKMKVKESWVYAVLSGEHGRTFSTVEKFARALGVSEKDLIK